MKAPTEKIQDQISKVNDLKDTILALQDEFDKAEIHGDASTLQKLLTDDFLSIGPKGFVLDKNEWITRHTQFKYEKLETTDKDIRIYDKAAIIRNIQRNEASFRNEPIKITVRVSQIWVYQLEQWKLAGIQFSPLT